MNLSIKDLTKNSKIIGDVIQMDFSNAIILSNDYYINEANGVPKNCFLIAVSELPNSAAQAILLSVKNVADLNSSRDIRSLKEELSSTKVSPDAVTLTELQKIGYQCKIVGSFYEQDGQLLFGSDIDRVLAYSSYTVYKPVGESLGHIASYTRPNYSNKSAQTVRIGNVRYTETQTSVDKEAAVHIDVRDFVGKKTALFGTSRSGKSNTNKIIVQQVFLYSKLTQQKIGQIIFDPQGEYANSNVQDAGALSNMGDGNDVVIYKTTASHDSGNREKPLLLNFFDKDNIQLVWDLMISELNAGASAGANYISGLNDITFEIATNAEKSAKIRNERKKTALYALMSLARINGKLAQPIYLPVGEENDDYLATRFEGAERSRTTDKGTIQLVTTDACREVFQWAIENATKMSDSWQDSLNTGELAIFKDQILAFNTGRRGVTSAFARIKGLHSEDSRGDLRESVWDDLSKGRLVIVDLSRGSTTVTKALSELIANSIINHASDRFVNGKEMIPIQIVVEEAHNLFSKNDKSDEMSPWVRLSKEAAKYEIGLMYATQEVSSVDPKILSNTANWIISHLNSKKETNELETYYTFGEWSEHLRATETKGFARIKTESSPFIIPVQIDKFDPNQR